jgi:molybdopterin synthase catalytic subunit
VVVRLEYEAYEPMAVDELHRVAVAARAQWPSLHRVVLLHRLGEVPVGEASVIVVASSAHRRAALDAVAFCIDRLKETVPIWKKEVYADHAASWKANAAPT